MNFNETFKYGFLIFLVGSFFFVEIITGLLANSLTLQTDAFHMLSDLLAIIIALISHRLTFRNKTYKYTYGWARSEIIGGFINCIFLLATCFFLLLEIIHRFTELVENNGLNPKLEEDIDIVLIVGGIGLFINIIGMFLFHNHSHHHGDKDETIDNDDNSSSSLESGEITKAIDREITNHNQAALYLHILGDFLGSIVVIATSLLIKYVDWKWKFYFDPLASLFVIVVIVYSNIKLFRYSFNILLHRTPSEIDVDNLLEEIKSLHGIDNIHDFHLWSLTNIVLIASLHVKLNDNFGLPTDDMLRKIKGILHKHQIHSSCIQIERAENCCDPRCHQNCQEYRCCN